jgi:hypothetical protein
MLKLVQIVIVYINTISIHVCMWPGGLSCIKEMSKEKSYLMICTKIYPHSWEKWRYLDA